MENSTSLTALMSSFGRVYHAENDQPILFNDRLSRELMTETEYQQIQGYILNGIDFFAPDRKDDFDSAADMLKWIIQTQLAPTPLARAKFCEDALKNAVHMGTRQYVILGAGMDTFAFRHRTMLNHLHVFEVDQPLTQADKQQRISRAGWKVPNNLCFVPMDFTIDDLSEKLLAYGFQENVKTFFSWLGVSYYLTKEQIENMVKTLGTLAAEGSTFLFDYADNDLFTTSVKRVQNMIAMAAASGEPMKSSFDYPELEQLLEKHHFLIYEHLSRDEIQQKYFADRLDYLTAFEHIQYVLSVLK